MKIVSQAKLSAFLRRLCFFSTMLLVLCSSREYSLAQVSGLPSIPTSQGIRYLNLNATTPQTGRVSDKNTTQLTAQPDTAWFFNTQFCSDPVVDTIGIRLFIDFPTTRLISGRIDSVRILNVPPTSTFRLLSPLSPTNITAGNSVRIIASFNSNQIGTSTATLRAYSVDSAGNAIPIRDFPIYTRREQRSFELITKDFDFGTLPPNTPATATIPFVRNTGTVPMDWEIPNSFGVFRATILRPVSMPSPSNPTGARITIVQPGDTIMLSVTFPGEVAGKYTDYSTNPRDFICNIIAPTFFLEARTAQNPANITVTPAGSPITPIDFGVFACSNREAPYKDTTLKVFNSGQVTLRVTGANFSLPDYQIISPQTLSETSPLLVPFNQSRDLIVRYTPRLTNPPDRTAVLTLFSNAQTGVPLGVTTVNVKALKDSVFLTLSTQDVDFGAVQRDSPSLTRTITITNTGTLGKAWIVPVSLGNGFVIESVTPAITSAGGTSQAVVRFSGTSVAGQFSAIWNVVDDCLRQTPVTVRISIDKPRPGIGVVSPIAFGVLSCSSDTTVSITVRNTSNDGQDLIIQQLNILGANSPFSLVSPPPLPLTIRSGMPQTLQIRFRPQRTGILTDTLRFVSNADDSPIFNVVLQGGKDSIGFRLSRTTISFVNVFPNTSFTDTLVVRNIGTTPIAWGSSGRFALGGAFTVQGISPQVTPPGGASLVTVRFLGSSVDASAMGTLTDACNRTEVFAVQATILPPRIAVTQSVQFATLTCETSSRASITVQNIGGQDLVITSIPGGQQGIAIEGRTITTANPLRIMGGRDTTLTLLFQPMMLGQANAVLTYLSNAVNDRMNTTSSTLSAVKNVRDFEFVPQTNPLFATFGKLPPNTPSTQTFRLRNTGNLPITWNVPFRFGSDNVFTLENISPNPTPPGAMADVTVRFSGNACGRQFFAAATTAILSGFGFQCDQNRNIGASAETESASARLRLESITGGIGDEVFLPIRLENARFLREAGVKEFQVELRFNKTIMYPTGTNKGQTRGNERIISVTLPLPNPIPADSVLARIPFRITLGNTTATQVFLDNANASGVCVNLDTASARTSASRICFAGGTRLVEISTTTTILVNAKPNPVTDVSIVDFSLLERGYTTLTLINTMGQVVKRLLEAPMEPGVYSLEVEASSLPTGVYFYILQTPTERITRRLEVVR